MDKATKTSSFGVNGRTSHDSSIFYNSKLYAMLPKKKMNALHNYLIL